MMQILHYAMIARFDMVLFSELARTRVQRCFDHQYDSLTSKTFVRNYESQLWNNYT